MATRATASIENHIAGRWQQALSGATYTRLNPAHIAEQLGPFPDSGPEDVAAAVEAAVAAMPSWAKRTFAQRGEVLFRAAELVAERAERIAADMTREMGKPITEARGEVLRCVSIFRYYGGEAWRSVGEVFHHATSGGTAMSLHRPRGVIGMITPWNFPVAIPAWKVAPALVFGNTVVLKVSEDSPLSSLGIIGCLVDAGLPAGVLNAVIGHGPAAGAALVEHPAVDAISFTGSVPVGHSVRRTATELGKPVQLELGGHNPLVIAADADLPRAVEAAFAGAYFSAGQKCTGTRRVLVADSVYEEFRSGLLARIAVGVIGDPAHQDTEVGPLVNESALNGVLAGIATGRQEGGTVIAGGARLTDEPYAHGYFVPPTLFENVDADGFLACSEVFGPVTTLFPVPSLEAALELANATSFGLSAAIFTSDLGAARDFARSVRAGVVHVNSPTPGTEVHVPFGGVKSSSWGSPEQGRAAHDFYTEPVTLYCDV